MKTKFITAASLQTPEGIQFLAFLDTTGEITTPEIARVFIKSMELLSDFPMTVRFWRKTGEVFNYATREDCGSFFHDLPTEEIPFGRIVLTLASDSASGSGRRGK